MRFDIELNGEWHEVDVRDLGDQRFEITIGDAAPQVVRAQRAGELVHHIGPQGATTAVVGFDASDRERVEVHTAGRRAALRVLDPRKRRRLDAAGGGGSRGGDIVAPMPGKVVAVQVEVGQSVERGQGVAIIEAMKMENELRAEGAGVVTAINVAAGDLVEANAVLVAIEPEG
jgi:biotin carboxyl carrier protein